MNAQSAHKIGITLASWKDMQGDAQMCEKLAAGLNGRAAILLSSAPADAPVIAFRAYAPKTYLTDTHILSHARLHRLCDEIYEFDGRALNPAARRAPKMHASSRIGFICSNGFGLGHVSRSQTMAALLAPFAQTAFMSFSAAFWQDIFYLPSAQYLELDEANDKAYTRESVLRFIAHARPTHLVFDGNILPSGLLMALSAHPDIHLTWVRRGMWQPDTKPKFMAQQAMADLVIEPDDWAQSYDTGPSWKARLDYAPPCAFLKTLPIHHAHALRLKDEARAALGLDAQERYALLMPGAAQKNEDVALIETAARNLRADGWTPVIAHWPMAHTQAPVIPGALTLERMPIAPFYSAFDVIISASGYNAFHEILATGVPAVFMPQEMPGTDQQLARANWAADQGLAQICRRTEIEMLAQKAALARPRLLVKGWLEEGDSIAQAMALQPGGRTAHKNDGKLPSRRTVINNLRRLHRRFIHPQVNAPRLVVALDVPAPRFLEKMKNRRESNVVVVTNSVDPVILRRSGYKYVWLNAKALDSDIALRRQLLNWLRIWRPVGIDGL